MVESDDIAPAGVRLGIRTDNLLNPKHVLVWAEADLEAGRGRLDAHEPPEIIRTPIPLAAAFDLTGSEISSDNREGPQSIVIPLAHPSHGRAVPVARLVAMVRFGMDRNAGTTSAASLRVRRDGGLVADATLEGFEELRPGEWKAWSIVDDITPFDRNDIDRRDLHGNDTVTLHVLGTDKAQIASVIVFGLADPAADEPQVVHQLVYTGMKSTPLDAWVGGSSAAERKLKFTLANYLN